MFGFGKKSKISLAKRVVELSEKAGNEFLEYIKRDKEVYDMCVNDTPIKNTSSIYMMQIYTDMLSSKYYVDDVFIVIRTALSSSAPSKEIGDLSFNTMMSYGQQLRQVTDYYKQLPDYDYIKCLTNVYFCMIMREDTSYAEIESIVGDKVSYKKIYDYFKGVVKYSTLLEEKYDMRLK